MNHNTPENESLRRWTQGALRQLNGPSAPPDFAAVTLARIQREAAPAWYRLPWLQWPTAARWSSAVALLAFTTLLAVAGLPRLHDLLENTGWIRQITHTFDSLASAFQTWQSASRMTWAHLPRSLVFVLSLCFASLWISTFGLGTACWRMAQRTRHLP
jgi:hypothetical protein